MTAGDIRFSDTFLREASEIIGLLDRDAIEAVANTLARSRANGGRLSFSASAEVRPMLRMR